MIVNLPFEIWSRIASFLPQESVKKLYSVNHAMFEIAMEEKYRKVLLNRSKDLGKTLALLTYSVTSGYVRSVNLSPHILYDFIFEDQEKGTKINLQLAKVFRIRKRLPMHIPPLMEQVLHGFNSLSNIGSLQLQSRGYSNCRKLKYSMKLLLPTLISFKGLRALTLDIMVEGYQCLDPTMAFPLLETLRIVLSHAYCSTDSKSIVDDVIAPFVNNHHPTLQVFHLSSLQSTYTFDVPSFFLKLRHFPRLTTFGLWHPFVSIRQSDSAGVSHVLRLHSEQLLELSLHAKGPVQYSMYPTAEQWYAQEFLRIKLPKLKVLDLDIELYPDITQTASYLGQFRRTLTSLKLSVNTLSYEEVDLILGTFTEQDHLKEMRISVDVLSPKLFALMAAKLPSLEKLFFEFNEFDWNDSDEGVCPDYDGWNLRHLTVEPSNYAFREFEKCEKAMRTAFPWLETISASPKMSEPSD